MLNFHIVYRDSRMAWKGRMKLLDFIESLISKLDFPEHEKLPDRVLCQQSAKRRTQEICMKDVNCVKGFHKLTVLKGTMGGPNIRKTCIWCNQKGIMTVCKQCNVPVCSDDDCGNDSCNFSFHNAPVVCNLPYTP